MNMLSAGRNGTPGTIKEKEAEFCGCNARTTKHATVMSAYSDTAKIVMVSILSVLIIHVFSVTQRANIDSIMIVTVTLAMVVTHSVELA